MGAGRGGLDRLPAVSRFFSFFFLGVLRVCILFVVSFSCDVLFIVYVVFPLSFFGSFSLFSSISFPPSRLFCLPSSLFIYPAVSVLVCAYVYVPGTACPFINLDWKSLSDGSST